MRPGRQRPRLRWSGQRRAPRRGWLRPPLRRAWARPGAPWAGTGRREAVTHVEPRGRRRRAGTRDARRSLHNPQKSDRLPIGAHGRRGVDRCFPGCALASPDMRIPQTSRASPSRTTLYPAYIPREVAGSSRRPPVIPASNRAKGPALAGNPRLFPTSPETPRPACHAGGRGFESRRSRLYLQGFCSAADAVQDAHPA